MTELDTAQQQTLLGKLRLLLAAEGGDSGVEIIETHISDVLLAGEHAYKMKKAVDFGFLDYATLAKRRHWCEEELRLNRRTAPQLYLDVIPVGGSVEQPVLNHEPAIEYLLKMRRFDQQALMTQVLARDEFGDSLLMQIAKMLAVFHGRIEVADADSPYGEPDTVYAPVQENFQQCRTLLTNTDLITRLDVLAEHNRGFFQTHRPLFTRRKADGFIRECHGDAHLNNIVLLDGQPVLFDCIEFNDRLRFIDVISEVAFLFMDLEEHGRADLANRLLNQYLQHTGDFAGLRLMRFYLAYRAMVRAKVAMLRLAQLEAGTPEATTTEAEFLNYLQLAEHYTQPGKAMLIITHGVSGCGKTHNTTPLLAIPGMIRIRSDVERKRLYGLQAHEHSHSGMNADIYSKQANERTYRQLAEQAEAIIAGGWSVIVDAAFLRAGERQQFRQLAGRLNAPFHILSFPAEPAVLHRRILHRQQKGKDASEAGIEVLERQLAWQEPLDEDEAAGALSVDTTAPDHIGRLLEQVTRWG